MGTPYILQKIDDNNLQLGGENVGGIIITPLSYAKDGILAALLIASYEKRKGVDKFVETFPRYYSVYTKIKLDDQELTNGLEKLRNKFANEKIDDRDGIRIDFENEHKWILLRKSGTEPGVIRLIAEAREENELNTLVENIKTILLE